MSIHFKRDFNAIGLPMLNSSYSHMPLSSNRRWLSVLHEHNQTLESALDWCTRKFYSFCALWLRTLRINHFFQYLQTWCSSWILFISCTTREHDKLKNPINKGTKHLREINQLECAHVDIVGLLSNPPIQCVSYYWAALHTREWWRFARILVPMYDVLLHIILGCV